MTTPGALPPSKSVYGAPAISTAEMTEEQTAAYRLAQVAAIVAATGAARSGVANQATLMLVPLLRTMNPYNTAEVAAFALKAASLVELARQESGRLSWSSIAAQLSAYGHRPVSGYEPVGRGRTTALEIAYQRVAADYRRRMAAGVESITKLIAQAEEEKFQALGGAEIAKGRTGESNAKIQGTKRTPGSGGGSQSSATSGSGGGGSGKRGDSSKSGSGTSTGSGAGEERHPPSPVDSAKADREVNKTSDDRDAADAEAERKQREEERQQALDDAFDAEQELRNQARLSDAEKADLLERMAQHEMEVRTERMVNDDIALAARQAAQDAMKKAPRGSVTGYRRVLHPELSATGTCGLCIAASDRIYSVRELLPIHNLCKCEAVPIYGDADPGSQINDEDLGVLYAEAGDTTEGRALKEQRYVVFDHPELGPVLRNAKHSTKDIEFSPRESSASHAARFPKPAPTGSSNA